MCHCSATWSVTDAAVACVSGLRAGTDSSPWALSCACIDWRFFNELSTDDSMDSVSVEMKRNCGRGLDALRAIARGPDPSAVRTIMASVLLLQYSASAHGCSPGHHDRHPVVALQTFRDRRAMRARTPAIYVQAHWSRGVE